MSANKYIAESDLIYWILYGYIYRYMWPDLQKQGMLAQTTPCHLMGHVSGLEQNIFIL